MKLYFPRAGRKLLRQTLNEFFDDVLQRDQTDRLVEWITFPRIVHSLNEGHVPFVALFKILEDHVKGRVLKDKVTLALIEAAQHLQWYSIFGIDQG